MAMDPWPWLAVAGLGALHGLSPAGGWMFAAACGLRAGGGHAAWRALGPVAAGHAVSIAFVAAIVAQGVALPRGEFQALAGAALVGTAAWRLWRGRSAPAGTTALERRSFAMPFAISFLMAGAHGFGMMLVPALVPLCLADGPARAITASGSLALALAAVGVHMVAMLLTTGVVAGGVCSAAAMLPGRQDRRLARRAWTATLAATGLLLMAWR